MIVVTDQVACLAVQAPLTMGLAHVIGSVFTSHVNTCEFHKRLREVFKPTCVYSKYCVDHLPGSVMVLTFSTLQNPTVYGYKGGSARIRGPDLSYTLNILEVYLCRPPTLLTSDKKSYIA